MADSIKTPEHQRSDSDQKLVINNITVAQLNRTRQDIGSFRTAVKQAESVYFPRRKALLEIYREIEEDGRAGSCWDKRTRAVKNKPIIFKDKDSEIDYELTKVVNMPWFKKLCKLMLESVAFGHSLIEPVMKKGEIVDVELVLRQHVSPERGVIYTRLHDESSAVDYTKPPYSKRLLEVGDKRDLGLWLRVAPYVLYKRGGIADWATFSEMFGTPIRVYKYKPHDVTSRKEVEAQAETMGNAAYVIVPEGVSFELVKGNDASSDAIHSVFLEAMNKEISITILGQNMTSDDGASLSQSEVHLSEQGEIHKEDMQFIEGLINTKVIEWLNNYGHKIPESHEAKFYDAEKLTLMQKLTVFEKLSNIIELDASELYETFDLREPEGGAKLKVSQTPGIPNTATEDEDSEEEVSNEVNALYHVFAQSEVTAKISRRGYKEVRRVIQDVFDGKLVAGQVDKGLYNYYGENMWELFVKGYGADFSDLEKGSEAYKRLEQLYDNLYSFSAHKVYHEVKFMSEGVMKGGKKVDFKAFEKEALRIHKDYGVNFLDAEADFAQKSAQSVKQWERFDANKDILPNLKYVTAGDANVRDSHRKLDGSIVRIDSPQADLLTPPLAYGCRCDLEQVDEPTNNTLDEAEVDIPDAFRQNPFKTGKVFNGLHPYFKKVAKADKEAAKSDFGMKPPKTDG